MHLVRFLSAPGFVEPICEQNACSANKGARKGLWERILSGIFKFPRVCSKNFSSYPGRDVSALRGHPQHYPLILLGPVVRKVDNAIHLNLNV